MQPIFQAIANAIGAVTGAVNSMNPSNLVGSIGSAISGGLAAIGLASGGAVVQQGLAFIHAGETVLPQGAIGVSGQVVPAGMVVGGAGGMGGAGGAAGPTINVTVTGNTIDKSIDLNSLSQKVAKEIANEARRLRVW